jgi:hypothetical protein
MNTKRLESAYFFCVVYYSGWKELEDEWGKIVVNVVVATIACMVMC